MKVNSITLRSVNFRRTANSGLNYDQFGTRGDRGNCQTAFNRPCNKLLINLSSVIMARSWSENKYPVKTFLWVNK